MKNKRPYLRSDSKMTKKEIKDYHNRYLEESEKIRLECKRCYLYGRDLKEIPRDDAEYKAILINYDGKKLDEYKYEIETFDDLDLESDTIVTKTQISPAGTIGIWCKPHFSELLIEEKISGVEKARIIAKAFRSVMGMSTTKTRPVELDFDWVDNLVNYTSDKKMQFTILNVGTQLITGMRRNDVRDYLGEQTQYSPDGLTPPKLRLPAKRNWWEKQHEGKLLITDGPEGLKSALEFLKNID
tara:strand:- start:275 stop:1000 length:726 start_codon:yes stop_codon:yes gene_type:complete